MTPSNSVAPGQVMRTLVSGAAAVATPLRKVRFDVDGTVTIKHAGGDSPTLTVVAGESWDGVNVFGYTAVDYDGVVTGWE